MIQNLVVCENLIRSITINFTNEFDGGKEMVKLNVNNTFVNIGKDKKGTAITFAYPWLCMKVTVVEEARLPPRGT
jgi:hypothetical protein